MENSIALIERTDKNRKFNKGEVLSDDHEYALIKEEELSNASIYNRYVCKVSKPDKVVTISGDNKLESLDVHGSTFTHCIFASFLTDKCTFTDVTFENCRIWSSSLQNSVFNNCTFSNTVFSSTDLDGSIFNNCRFNSCGLKGCDFRGVDLSTCVISFAEFTSEHNVIPRNTFSRSIKLTPKQWEDLGVPFIPNFHSQILEAVDNGDQLEMQSWHTECGTAHCMGGWSIIISESKGAELERKYGSQIASQLLYERHTSYENSKKYVDFYTTNEIALENLKALAATEG